MTKSFWVAYAVVVALWALDLLYLAGLTLLAVLVDGPLGPVRTAGRDARLAASHYPGPPAPAVIAAAILGVVLMAMAVRARARAMAWVFGICSILVPALAYLP